MMTTFPIDHIDMFLIALPDPAIVVDENGIIISANDHANDLFQDATIGKHLTVALRAPVIIQAVSEATSQSKSARVQYLVRTPVSRNYDVIVSALAGGLALVMLRDVTYEEQIERMRSDFVANASHELRTPLASLTGFIETMQGAAKNDVKAKNEFLKLMKAQADRMARLIDDLLSLSRIEISEHVQPTGIADLALITNQVQDLLFSVAVESRCTVKIDIPASLPILGDADQLSQVVHNLVENAIKYSGNGKTVVVHGRIENHEVVLSVRDDGPGIAAHHVPRLTERFYRVNVQDSRNRGGTGLGLAIAKHIINRHRGKLVIESELGTGSVFTIRLPLQKNSL